LLSVSASMQRFSTSLMPLTKRFIFAGGKSSYVISKLATSNEILCGNGHTRSIMSGRPSLFIAYFHGW